MGSVFVESHVWWRWGSRNVFQYSDTFLTYAPSKVENSGSPSYENYVHAQETSPLHKHHECDAAFLMFCTP